MNIWYFILFIFLVFYLLLLVLLVVGISQIKISNPFKTSPKTQFSIIVPFRNEAHNLPDLLYSLIHLNYPKNLYEILLVNDASSDIYGKIIDTFKFQNPNVNIILIENQRYSNSPKKDAIHTAVKSVSNEWLITTDADCVFNQNILSELNSYISQYQPIFIAGLVKMAADSTMLQQFQKWDWNSLLGFTLAGFGLKNPTICSGAYLCYSKEIFKKIDGFVGNEHIASGDDVFLMQKMLAYQPEKVHYIFQPDVVVQTKPLKTWHELIEQRKRWMSKTGSVQNIFLKFSGIIVWLSNFGFIVSCILPFFHQISWRSSIIYIVLKWLIDVSYLILINKKIKEKINVSSLIISNIVYPFFSISITILWFFKGFKWKERTFKK